MGNRLSQSGLDGGGCAGSVSLSDTSSRELSAATGADCASTLSLVSDVVDGGGGGGGGGATGDVSGGGGLRNLGFFAPSLKDVNSTSAAESEGEQPPPPPPPPPPSQGPQPRSSQSSSASSSASTTPPSRPRICPILQNGRQVTKDFYWVLPERRSRRLLARQRSLQEPSSSLPRLAAPAADESDDDVYQNLPPSPTPRPQQPQATKARRTCQSESGRLAETSLVERVRRRVPGVTEDESRLALGLHAWDAGRAARYLMVEQLFRLGLAERPACMAVLEAADWRLEAAGDALVERATAAE